MSNDASPFAGDAGGRFLEESSSVVMLRVSPDGTILAANRHARTLLGEPLLGRPWDTVLLHVATRKPLVEWLADPQRPRLLNILTSSGMAQTLEVAVETEGDYILFGEVNAAEQTRLGQEVLELNHDLSNLSRELALKNDDHARLNALLARQKAELEATQARYFNLYELAPVGYLTVSEQGQILQVNLAAATLLGASPGVLLTQAISRFIHEEDLDAFYLHRKEAFGSGEARAFELRMVNREGTLFWAHLTASVAQGADGAPELRIVLKDITERELLRKELETQRDRLEQLVTERTAELRSMATELLTLEVRERRDLAESLHDDLGQNLAIAKLKLGALGNPGEGEGRERFLRQLKEIEALVDRSNQSVRTLSAQFSPPVLREFGLATALDWLSEELRRTLGLSIRLHLCDLGDMSEATATALYRMARELLINIAKHAQVGEAELIMAMDEAGENLEITVSDAGVGFDMERLGKRLVQASYGLSSIRQRLEIMKGRMSIDSQAGQGTIVTLSIPLAAQMEPV